MIKTICTPWSHSSWWYDMNEVSLEPSLCKFGAKPYICNSIHTTFSPYFNHCAPLTITIHPYLIDELHYHNVPLQHYAAWRTHPDASLTSIIDACFTECSPESILRMLFSSMMSSGISDDNSSSNYYSEMLK